MFVLIRAHVTAEDMNFHEGLKADGQHILATLTLTEREACKPGMLIEALSREAGIEGEIRMLITRTALLGMDEAENLVPLETL